ncbi:MAG: HAD family hydrolase [Oscillospiraceae bacterium]|nr:HAD family hydrolase [Oscillospiraceae bacterium]
MRYDAVLLDMDGTVLDTLEDLTDAVNAALRQFGLPEVGADRARASLGHGALWLIGHCVPEGSPEELTARVLEWYRPYYDAHCRIKTKPYEGVVPLLERLRGAGLRLAVISNKQDGAVKELAAAFFPGLLDCAVGERLGVRRKPYPDSALAAAETMGVAPERCIYVGDTEVDIETAANAGMACAAVCWGFRSREQLVAAGAERPAETVGELEERLTGE